MGKECRNGDAWGCELVNIYIYVYIYYVYNIYIYVLQKSRIVHWLVKFPEVVAAQSWQQNQWKEKKRHGAGDPPF